MFQFNFIDHTRKKSNCSQLYHPFFLFVSIKYVELKKKSKELRKRKTNSEKNAINYSYLLVTEYSNILRLRCFDKHLTKHTIKFFNK